MNHPDTVAFISSTGDTTNPLPVNTGLVDNFKVAYSPAYSFRNSIEVDAIIFTTFKEGKYWDTWRMNTLTTARAKDVTEVIN